MPLRMYWPAHAAPSRSHSSVRNAISSKGIHRPQACVELEAVDDPHLVVEPNVLRAQISMAVDDAVTTHACQQNVSALRHESALNAIDPPDEPGRQIEAGIEQNAAVQSQISRPRGEVGARGKQCRPGPAIKSNERGDQPIQLRGLEAALAHDLLERPSIVEPAHDDQPVDDASLSAER